MLKLLRTLVLAVLILVCGTAYADAGLPIIFIIMPNMILLLIPIIVIESIIVYWYLNIGLRKAMICSMVGNFASTIIGVPITWAGLALLQILTGGGGFYSHKSWWGTLASITWQAPWLLPYYENQYSWMVPAAVAFLLIPFFFVSWWIEGSLMKLIIPQTSKGKTYQASFYANMASYIFLELSFPTLWVKHLAS